MDDAVQKRTSPFSIIGDRYVKIWVSTKSDKWFLKLSCAERGLFMQLILDAKIQGGTGTVRYRSVTDLASSAALHRHTCGKFVANFATDKRIELRKDDSGVIEIIIPKYKYWQEVRGSDDDPQVEAFMMQKRGKSAAKIDKTSTDEINTEREERETLLDRWNAVASQLHLPEIKGLSQKRVGKLKLRTADTKFDFDKILEAVKESTWAHGNNDRGWKISFDFIIENDTNYLKVLEGKYKPANNLTWRPENETK